MKFIQNIILDVKGYFEISVFEMTTVNCIMQRNQKEAVVQCNILPLRTHAPIHEPCRFIKAYSSLLLSLNTHVSFRVG